MLAPLVKALYRRSMLSCYPLQTLDAARRMVCAPAWTRLGQCVCAPLNAACLHPVLLLVIQMSSGVRAQRYEQQQVCLHPPGLAGRSGTSSSGPGSANFQCSEQMAVRRTSRVLMGWCILIYSRYELQRVCLHPPGRSAGTVTPGRARQRQPFSAASRWRCVALAGCLLECCIR